MKLDRFVPILVCLSIFAYVSPAAADTLEGDLGYSLAIINTPSGPELSIELSLHWTVVSSRFGWGLVGGEIGARLTDNSPIVLENEKWTWSGSENSVTSLSVPIAAESDGYHALGVSIFVENSNEVRRLATIPVFVRVANNTVDIVTMEQFEKAGKGVNPNCESLCNGGKNSPKANREEAR